MLIKNSESNRKMDPSNTPGHVEMASTDGSEQQVHVESRKLTIAEVNILTSINQSFQRWYKPWRDTYFLDGREFISIFELMEGLLHYEQQIKGSKLAINSDRADAIARAVARLIDYGNAILNLDLVLRAKDDTLRELDPLSMTTVALFQAHKKAHKLREKLLYDYFRKDKPGLQSGDETSSGTPNISFQFFSLQVPTSGSNHSLQLSPTLERSHRSSIGSNSSINAIHTMDSGRRTPQNLPSPNQIEVKPVETVLDSHIEVVHMTATIRSNAFLTSSPTRLAFLPGILLKIDELMSIPATHEKLNNCFELMDTLLDAMEKIPADLREKEVYQIANCLLKPLVRKVYIEDRSGYPEPQHTHWTTLLLSIIKLMTATDFNTYLSHFSKLADLGTFLKDYLFIIKRYISANDNHQSSPRRPSLGLDFNNSSTPTYPDCWIEMKLLACSTFLKSLTQLYQVVRQLFHSNPQMWSTFIDCLVHFILHDALKPDRLMHKERQRLMADDLRKISAEYVWICWNSLSSNQKQSLLEDLIEPLLRATLILSSRQRSILLPIFYDMMRCDYTSQYITPRSSIYNQTLSTNSSTFNQDFQMYQQYIGNKACDDFESLPPIQSQPSISITSDQPEESQVKESLPYLSFQDVAQDNQDGTVLTKFTHLLVGRLNNLMIDLGMGDESFQIELCAAIAGDLSFRYNDESSFSSYGDTDRFKCMAKQTSDLIAEFIQICLDSRRADRLSYKHLYLLCLFKLVLFFRDKVDRKELYLYNLYKLCYLHHSSERYVEAGYALLEHAKSLPWSNKPLESHYKIVNRYFLTPHQLNDYESLKVFLYNTIIEYFDQGQVWEPAIPLCRELVDHYQFKTLEYGKLAQILQKMSTYFNNIVELSGQKRSNPEYFRVTFYGEGFPSVLKNTTMVYRGRPYEKLSDFQATMLTKYPDADLFNSLLKPGEPLVKSKESRLLQINACSPIVDLKTKLARIGQDLDLNEVDPTILNYYMHNECDKFTFSRRIMSSNGDGDNFANIWREKTTLTTNTLPGMLPFFPVYLMESTMISPIESAIEDLERTNERLANAVRRFKDDKRQNEDVRSLGQLLTGVVDAAVNGGIAKYEEAFLNTRQQVAQSSNQQNMDQLSMGIQRLLSNTGDRQQVPCLSEFDVSLLNKLKSLIAQQIPLLDEAIRIHSSRVADVMRPQHEHLEASYKKLKHHVMTKYSKYLPADYGRHSGTMTSSLRSMYRSMARSPSRSLRNESRHTTLASSGNRIECKRMSDVCGAASKNAISDAARMPPAAEVADHSSSSIPYKQLSNERRSLPFLTGVPLIDKEFIRDSRPERRGAQVSSMRAKSSVGQRQEMPKQEDTSVHQTRDDTKHKYQNLTNDLD